MGEELRETGTPTRRELIVALLFLAALVTLFFSPTIFTGRYLSPADMLFGYRPWSEVRPAGWTGPSNDLLIDSVAQFEPWLHYASERLRAGSFPLWNPDNMLGAPFMGNMQSALFWPLNWLYFLWPDGWVLVFRAWLKLFVAASGMYVLARTIAWVGPFAAGVAAVTFAFSAYMINWLLHPHVGSAMLLPWLWWATARLISRATGGRIAFLAALVALDLFAGHPETTFHMAVATGAFALFYVWHSGPPGLRAKLLPVGAWVLAYGLGALIASVQLLPFLEYTSDSMALLRRTERQGSYVSLPLQYAWTLFSPDLFGNPARRNWWGPGFDYNSASIYAGVLPLLLAPLALLARDKGQRRLALFLLGLVAVCLAVIFHVPLLADAVLLIPGMGVFTGLRLSLIAGFALALLASLGVHALTRPDAPRRRMAVVLGVSVLVLMLVDVVAPSLLAGTWFAVPAGDPVAQETWWSGIWRVAFFVPVIGAISALALLLRADSRGMARHAPTLALLLLVTVDMLQARMVYMPSVAPGEYFPATQAIEFLRDRRAADDSHRVTAGPGIFFPNTNLFYGLSDFRGDDALIPRRYIDLATGAMRVTPYSERATAAGLVPSPILDLLNVRYVLAPPGDDPNYVLDVRQEASGSQNVGEVWGEKRPGQTFIAGHDNLAQIQVLGATYGGKAKGKLFFHLQADERRGLDLARIEVDVTRLADNAWWTISFPGVQDSAGRRYYFYVEAPEARPGEAVTLWYSLPDAYPDGTRLDGDNTVEGDLAFRALSSNSDDGSWFRRVLDGGNTGTSIYENTRSLPRAWFVHKVEVVPDRDERLRRLRDPGFDRAGTAILDNPLPSWATLEEGATNRGPTAATQDAESVEIADHQPERVIINTRSAIPALLVLADQSYPGWEASIDGQSTPIYTVNHALRGVYVPAGTHNIMFEYRPASVTWGLVLSGLGILLLFLLTLQSAIRIPKSAITPPTTSPRSR